MRLAAGAEAGKAEIYQSFSRSAKLWQVIIADDSLNHGFQNLHLFLLFGRSQRSSGFEVAIWKGRDSNIDQFAVLVETEYSLKSRDGRADLLPKNAHFN
jgi:hypothetical protein